MRSLTWIALALLAIAPAQGHARSERHYQEIYCAGMELEHVLPSGGRVDCLSAEYAIEMDWAENWAEAVGQSLYYAQSTGRTPGIILLCPSSQAHAEGLCRSYLYRLGDALAWVHVPAMVWECFIDTDRALVDCLRPDLSE